MRAVWFLVLLAGCEFADVDTGDSGSAPPDLVGTYTSTASDVTGCEGVIDLGFLTGTLTIAGEPDALVFTWGELEVGGQTDLSAAVTIQGDDVLGDFAVTFEADGIATLDAGDAWNLDLGFGLDASSAVDTGVAPCSASGSILAVQDAAR